MRPPLSRRPLPEDDFWQLIAAMDGRADDDAVERLAASLASRPRRDAFAFQERLARVLYELDREELARQPVRFSDDPPGSTPIPLSDDSFLYLRAGVVAAGRDRYQAVLADPSLLANGVWDDGEALLYVAEDVTGDEIDTKISYETGSNERHWPALPEPEREEWDQGPRPVIVDLRDLSQPIDGEQLYPDGRTEPFQLHLPPDYVDSDDLTRGLTMTFAKIIATNGGLPAHLEATAVMVAIEFGAGWRLPPLVSEPAEDPQLMLPVVEVRVGVDADTVRAWSRQVQREALLALTASCVLAILPEEHPARPEVQDHYERGAGHLPW